MGDVVSCEEGGDQVGDGTSLTTVGTELEGVQSSLPGVGQILIQCNTVVRIYVAFHNISLGLRLRPFFGYWLEDCL